MSKGTEDKRRRAFDDLMADLRNSVRFYDVQYPSKTALAGEPYMNASAMLWSILDVRYGRPFYRPLMSEIARDLGINDEVARLAILGKREPSKGFLDAIGYERVVLYRRKDVKP